MKNVYVIPEINCQQKFNDIISRVVWHFYGFDVTVNVSLANSVCVNKFSVPESLDNSIEALAEPFLKQVSVLDGNKFDFDSIDSGDSIVLNFDEYQSCYNLNKIRKQGFPVYRIDKDNVRQEGSFYIQAVYDHLVNVELSREEDSRKFKNFCSDVSSHSFKHSIVLATGPSIKEAMNFDFEDSFVVACNSTIMDAELMAISKPKVLVFADPIYHFGVSKYSAEFRTSLKSFLLSNSSIVMVPEKYRHIVCRYLSDFSERVIGVPYSNIELYNFDLKTEFHVKTSSNILTFLLLPIATTFSKNVKIAGCDGRPVNAGNFFWEHGDKVKINTDAQNIKDVHPGFFNINYEEYYFEHLKTLECMLSQGEEIGISFEHSAHTFIPSFLARNENNNLNSSKLFILEPDGVGDDGHFVPWHNSLTTALDPQADINFLINKKQDASLYLKGVANNVFTSFSWSVSRAEWCLDSDFFSNPTYVRFKNELKEFLDNNISEKNNNTVFIYFGSSQIAYCFYEVYKEITKERPLINISFNICIFHESVILKDSQKEPNFPHDFVSWFSEMFVISNVFRFFAATEELRDYIYSLSGCYLKVLPNPPPNISFDSDNFPKKHSLSHSFGLSEKITVGFPGRARPEKGQEIVLKLIKNASRIFEDYPDHIYKISRIDCSEVLSNDVVSANLIFSDSVNMSDSDYIKFINECDLICLPYKSPYFKYRTSGIIVDVFRLSKPMIVVKGTWLARWVNKTRSGLVINDYSEYSIASAVEAIKKNYNFFYANAQNSYYIYSSNNKWSDLVDLLL